MTDDNATSTAAIAAIPLEPSAAALPGRAAGVSYDRVLPEFLAGDENVLVVDLMQGLPLGDLTACSPVYLYGPSGVGKTALAVTLLARWVRSRPEAKVVQVTAVDFARQLAGAIDADDMPHFREKYRRCEAFLIDAVEGLANRPAAQEELLHTVDWLHEAGGLVVCTGADLPQMLRGISRPLQSRLAGGASVPVAPPRPSAYRRAIDALARQSSQTSQAVAPAVRELMVSRIPPSTAMPAVRGIFNEYLQDSSRLLELRRWSQPEGPGAELAVDQAAAAARIDLAVRRRDPLAALTVGKIAQAVAKQLGCTVEEMRGAGRQSSIVAARSLAMYLARELLAMPLAAIGRYFGGRDHTTVLHAVRKIDSQLANDTSLQRAARELRRRLGANQRS